jgi:hypothetical protein
LFAEATNKDEIPLPISCQWSRIKGERLYQIPEIHSNVYQLSAEDIGCVVRVMTTPIEPESESGASGIAYGEFGPIELDPSARQTLEQVLGTGGS